MGCLEELSKLEDMSAAANSPHLLTCESWPVKFRLINRETVLPSQVTNLTHSKSESIGVRSENKSASSK